MTFQMNIIGPVWIIPPLVAKLPLTNQIVFCCLDSLALTVLAYVEGSAHFSLQNKPQTFLFKFAFTSQHGEDGKTGEGDKCEQDGEGRKEVRKRATESMDKRVSTLLNMTETAGMPAMFLLPLTPSLVHLQCLLLSPPSSASSFHIIWLSSDFSPQTSETET